MKNINSLIASVCFFLCIAAQPIYSQVTIEGYAFESGNRGFLNEVFVQIYNSETNELISRSRSDRDGKFELTAPAGKKLILKGSKDLFHDVEIEVNTADKKAGEKAFVKLELTRAPGYIFDITMAEKREEENQVVDAIRGALIEVYNNTTREPILVLDDHPHPDFKIDLEKGNHYTIMIRKKGYLAKRMEAFVNVKGCILCFEGVGEVQPGVSDNLTQGNSTGTLLANVELDKLYSGKKITLNNIYYDLGKSTLRSDAIEELENAATFMRDNPGITIELSAHTDVRGKSSTNQILSDKRAQNTVDWLVENGEIAKRRIVARGYGETQIMNKCKEGVDCTEAEHGVNRRTEVKILSIAPEQEFKSLEKIKFEENMDKMIEELQSEGQVKVQDEKELENYNKENVEAETKTEENVEVEESELTEEKVIEKKNIETKIPTGTASTDLTTEIKSEEVAIVAETVVEPVEAVQEQIAVAENEVAEVLSSEIDKATDTQVEEITSSETIEEVPSEVMDEGSRLNTIKDFSGYKYVIHFSGEALPDDHTLFKTHDDLTVLQTGSNNFLYMIGDYASEVYAKSGLNVIKKQYPEAYVIGFKKGERTE